MIAIFDIDGVLADDSLTAKLNPLYKHELKKFESLVSSLKPKEDIVRVARLLKMAGYRIVIFTARSEKIRGKTQDWLWGCGIDFNVLEMRPIGNVESAAKLKKAMLDRFCTIWPESMGIIYFENDPEICAYAKNERITVCEVH